MNVGGLVNPVWSQGVQQAAAWKGEDQLPCHKFRELLGAFLQYLLMSGTMGEKKHHNRCKGFLGGCAVVEE